MGVDEFGKLKDVDILARHLVSLKAAKYMHYCTTIESMSDAQIEVIMNFWEQSNGLIAYQNENKETPTKLSRLFISSIFGYIDATTRGTSKEIRFTQKDRNLYATVLAWPEEKQVIIKSLAKGNTLYPGKISKVELLGYGKVTFTRTNQGLIINMPDKQINKIAPVFKIK